MGRFTSVQGFADNNSNNRTITYDQAKGKTEGNDNGKLVTEKVVNPYGSTSGAGSGEFHVYRHARAREMARWNALDLEEKEKKEEIGFRTALENDRKEMETKVSKNRKKRQREKEAKRRKKVMKAAGIDTQKKSFRQRNDQSEVNQEEEFTYVPVSQQQRNDREENDDSSTKKNSNPSKNNDNVIPNDGSFLEMMKKTLSEEKKKNDGKLETTGCESEKT
mmetsp:Transcript_25770/g.60416  ORF Transcript_25770/g.60416 Transcript_25770/m.60416 type:complete len:220 (+) Transcript_25770:89-748(+)